MKCLICKFGDTVEGRTSVTLTRGESTVVLKDIPADICQNCGEYYLSDQVSAKIMKMAETANTDDDFLIERDDVVEDSGRF